MTFDLYQIDSFTDKIFGGNPACVVPLTEWLSEDVMKNIARENAVAETAFFVPNGGKFYLRWFTPEIEMDLCGHATIATAHALKTILGDHSPKFVFDTLSGPLTVTVSDGIYSLDLPSRKPLPAELPDEVRDALNILPQETWRSRDFVLLYNDEDEIRNIRINRNVFDKINLDPGGVAVTAKGIKSDFVSRYFTPQASILEDPVTGSAHCSLIPFWSERLGKQELTAMQLSERTGKLLCRDFNDRVTISGMAKTYFIGKIFLE
jgi:PhzF family phenazine biosynthesis protein